MNEASARKKAEAQARELASSALESQKGKRKKHKKKLETKSSARHLEAEARRKIEEEAAKLANEIEVSKIQYESARKNAENEESLVSMLKINSEKLRRNSAYRKTRSGKKKNHRNTNRSTNGGAGISIGKTSK